MRPLSPPLSPPLFPAKVRLRPSHAATSELCRGLQEAGASVICVHGRTAAENKQQSGACDWEAIARLVSEIDIPLIANGGVSTIEEAERCLFYPTPPHPTLPDPPPPSPTRRHPAPPCPT